MCEVPCWNVSRSDDRHWTPPFCCSVWPDGLHSDGEMLQRRDLSRSMAERNGCCSWASGGCWSVGAESAPHPTTGYGCGEGRAFEEVGAFVIAFPVVLVHCCGAAGAFVEGFSKMVLQAAAARAAALLILIFNILLGASAGTTCKYVLCKFE